MSGTAVVLFNLGGPERLEDVRPFLRNLFGDPAIIAAPGPVRWPLARLIAARRAKTAREIYARMGGGSPLRRLTEEQARALEARLEEDGNLGPARVFVAMRYWHPFVEEAVEAVSAYDPDRVLLLPLYPQFSTATTGSSLTAWRRAARKAGLRAPTAAIGCYPADPAFIAAHAALIEAAIAALPPDTPWRLLLSAHGLPKRTVARGDPYQWQVERTAERIVEALPRREVDWRVCYQSRVGPLKWIGPSIDDEIGHAGADGRAVVVAPIAFVSEHSETLVELDIEYRAVAERRGVPRYVRVPALGTHPDFIAALGRLVRRALDAGGTAAGPGHGICPRRFGACPCRARAGP